MYRIKEETGERRFRNLGGVLRLLWKSITSSSANGKSSRHSTMTRRSRARVTLPSTSHCVLSELQFRTRSWFASWWQIQFSPEQFGVYISRHGVCQVVYCSTPGRVERVELSTEKRFLKNFIMSEKLFVRGLHYAVFAWLSSFEISSGGHEDLQDDFFHDE